MKRSLSQSLANLRIFLNEFKKIIIIIVQVTVTAKQHLADTFNLVKKITNWIKENIIWIFLTNLMIMGFKLLTIWVHITVTMMQDGVTGVLAIWYVLWCASEWKSRQKCKAKDHPSYPRPKITRYTISTRSTVQPKVNTVRPSRT